MEVFFEQLEVSVILLRLVRGGAGVRPEVGGEPGDFQAVVGDEAFDSIPFAFHRVVVDVNVRFERADLHAIKFKFAEAFDDGVKRHGVVFVGAKSVSPTANRQFFCHVLFPFAKWTDRDIRRYNQSILFHVARGLSPARVG